MSSDQNINIIVLGESGVGKTSLLLRFSRDIYRATTSTLILDIIRMQRTVQKKKCALRLWDTGGQEKYRSMVQKYYRTANGVLLIYDVTDVSTFMRLSSWLSELRKHNEEAIVVIVGNKTDEAKNAVELNTVKRFAENEELEYFECSAKTGENVHQIFDHLIFKVLKKRGIIESPTLPRPVEFLKPKLLVPKNDKIEVQDTDQKPKKKGCCG